MKSKEEREFEEYMRFWEEFRERYRRLPRWRKIEVSIFIYWLVLKNKVKKFPLTWVKMQVNLDRDMKIHGMPYKLKLLLGKCFNRRPWPQSIPLILKKVKFWVDYMDEDDNFEIHVTQRGRWVAMVWAQPAGDELTLYSLHISKEKFLHYGLGKYLFAKVLAKASTLGVKRIRTTHPKDSAWPQEKTGYFLAWCQRQGFVLTEDKEDYVLTLYLPM